MSLANGVNVFDIKQTKEIVGILRARTKNNVELQKLHEELSGLGLLNKGVVARDLKGLASDLQGIKSKSVLDIPANLAKGFLNKTGISKHAEKWQNAYIAEDDFFKVNMYFREKKNLEKINNMYSKESGLKLSEQQLKEEAAKMVRDVLPNYDLVPELLKELRSTPFFGRFFSFMAESTRISANSITNGIKEVSKGKALIKQGEQKAGQEFIKRGTLRLGAFTAMAGAGAKGAETVSKATTGITTDTLDAIKDLVLPDYMQNSNVILSVAPDGSPVVSNLSSWDAFDFPKKPFQVIINKYMAEDSLDEEGLLKEILTTTISETVSPFLGESIIQEQISNYVLRGGRTLDGNLMRNPFNRLSKFNDSGNYAANLLDGENLSILMANLLESITPGSITRGQDLHKTLTNKQGKTPYDQDEYEAQAFLKFVTGWGMQPINPEYTAKMYEFKANDYLKSKRQAQSSITSAIGQELDRDTFVGEYLKRSNEHYESYIKFHKNTKSLEKLDIDVYSTIRNTNVSKKDRVAVMYSSNYEPIGLSDSLRAKMLDAAPNFDTYEEIYKDIMAIDREMSRIPVQISPLYYKKQKQKIKDIKKDLRENYKTGGKVPNVQEDPADRKNPVMQESYSQTSKGLTGLQKALQEATEMLQPKEQMERLGFKDGGGTRVDGTKKSLRGWLGPIKNNVTGQTMTEVSMGIGPEDNQKLIPLLVPTLNKKEIESLQNMKIEGNIKNIPQSIKDKAILHAQERENQGLNVFYKGNKRVAFEKGGMTDTINSYLTKYRTQPEKQYKKGKDGKFLKDKNGELIDAGYNKEVNKEPDKFVKDMYLKLKESGHPFPKMAAAQAGAESEYGMSALSRKANNTFGVKVRKGEKFKGVMMPTKEDYGQGQVDEVANFRAYDTVDDNIKGYINFLNTGNYDKALNAKSDMEYLQELKNAGYATDQDYVTTVGSVYKRNLESGTFD